MSRKATLVMHLPKNEIEHRYRKESNPRVKQRLLAILNIVEGKTIEQTGKIVRASISSVKRWISSWNKEGLDGLIPHFDGGPKPRIPESEWDEIVKEVENKAMTLKDVGVYVKDTRGVRYTYGGVWRILRKKRHERYGKPYKMNAKRPPNAEEILKKPSQTH